MQHWFFLTTNTNAKLENCSPVAALNRSKQVMVSLHHKMAVADHDFTKVSVIPSVAMICNIPPDVTGSFYAGQMHVGIKDAIFEPSSPLRHATDHNGILDSIDNTHLFDVAH